MIKILVIILLIVFLVFFIGFMWYLVYIDNKHNQEDLEETMSKATILEKEFWAEVSGNMSKEYEIACLNCLQTYTRIHVPIEEKYLKDIRCPICRKRGLIIKSEKEVRK